MELQKTYSTLYLYNALLEYVYFIIIFLQVKGPANLNNIIQHTHFFKADVCRFIEIFSGKDFTEKLGNMLCTTTHAFDIKGSKLHLQKNFLNFKQIVYKDLIVTKVIDLIIRGTHTVKSICRNLNMTNVLNIEEDSLISILKQLPYFHLDSDPSLIVLQVHSVLGFDVSINETVVQYFQSYLQNINELSYDEIKFHSRFVPSCAIHNSLVIFCVLHTSAIFKCKNNKICLRRKMKRQSNPNQMLNMDTLGVELSESVPVGVLVLKAYGSNLRSWKGEISLIKKDFCFIQCVVTFSNGSQGIFEIYFYKVALKFICEIESLEDFLNVRDVVEFDATFCDIAAEQGRFWEATYVKVIKQGLKTSTFQHELDVNKYIENINLDYHQLKTTSKSCNSKNCLGDYFALVKDAKISNNTLKSKPSGNDLKHSYNNQPSLCHTSLLVHDSNQNLLLMKSENQNGYEKDFEIHDHLDRDKGNESFDEKRISHEGEESLGDGISVSNFLFSHTSFMFGEITISSQDEGVAVSMLGNKQYEIYFKYDAIFFYNFKSIPKKSSQVLIFVPYMEEQGNFLVATLVYLLDGEEAALVREHGTNVEDFLLGHFMPKVKVGLRDSYSCYCQLLHSLQIGTKAMSNFEKCREVVSKCFDSLNLKDLVLLNDKTSSQLKMLIKTVYTRNLEMDLSELCKHVTDICFNASSSIRHSKKLNVCNLYRKETHRPEVRRRKSFHRRSAVKISTSDMQAGSPDIKTMPSDVKSFPESRSCIIRKESKDEDGCVFTMKKSNKRAIIQSKPYLMPAHESYSSTSSYTSCISKCSSEDTFHSCESLNEFESDLETNDCREKIAPNPVNSDEGKSTGCVNHDGKLEDGTEIKNSYASDGPENLIKIQVHDYDDIDFEKCTNGNTRKQNYCLKLKQPSPLKAVSKKKYKVLLPSRNYSCKRCYRSPLESTAYISTITKSCLLLSVKLSQQNVTLCFPRCLIPQEMQKFVKLNTLVKIHITPNILLNLSHVSRMVFCV